MTGPPNDVTGHVIGQTQFSLSLMCPPTPSSACVWGGGVSVGPAIRPGPGTISMKVEWVQGAPLHLHTQLHTQVLGHLCGGGKGLPSTIVFWLGLSLPAAVVWAAFYFRGAKG